MLDWVEHEHWIQNGCPDAAQYELRVPGYQTAARDGVDAYDLYRHSFVPYFAEALGFSTLHENLTALIRELKNKYPRLAIKLLDNYADPDTSFRAQWDNLFDVIFHDGMTHQTLLQYQRKFEVELPLRFLGNTRELLSTGTFDPNLSRFRDNSGKLRKGVLAQYIKDGFKEYPAVASVVGQAYDARLRNAIGHNAYSISQGHLRSLDGGVVLTEAEFVHRLEALQTLQNAVLWLLMSRPEHDRSSLKSSGVLAIAWGWLGDHEGAHVSVLQLAPFFSLNKEGRWFDKIVLQQMGDQLVTKLADAHPIEGLIPNTLQPIIDEVRQSRNIHCALIPIMPCIHQHETYSLPQGEFCPVSEGAEGIVSVDITA